MISLIISHEKYHEIHSMISDPILGSELGLFRKHCKCDIEWRNGIRLVFDNEKDLVWFKLKWL